MICSALILQLVIGGQAVLDSEVKHRKDSIYNVMEIDFDGGDYEELSGTKATHFSFYTTAKFSVVLWSIGQDFYNYRIEGSSHDSRALAIVGTLEKQGLQSFVAKRQAYRVDGFSKHFGVLAIRTVLTKP